MKEISFTKLAPAIGAITVIFVLIVGYGQKSNPNENKTTTTEMDREQTALLPEAYETNCTKLNPQEFSRICQGRIVNWGAIIIAIQGLRQIEVAVNVGSNQTRPFDLYLSSDFVSADPWETYQGKSISFAGKILPRDGRSDDVGSVTISSIQRPSTSQVEDYNKSRNERLEAEEIRRQKLASAPQPSFAPTRVEPSERQIRFIDAVKRYSREYSRANGNDVYQDRLRIQRARELCNLMPNLTVQGWIGVIEDIITLTQGGNARVVISMASSINVAAPEIGSLFGPPAHVQAGSPLYNKLINLNRYQRVEFDGTFLSDSKDCIKEESIFTTNGMQSPTFNFRFSDIRSIP